MRAFLVAGVPRSCGTLFLLGAGLWAASFQSARPVPRAPAPRSAQAMAYDGTNKVTLLFGGGGAILFRDLWAWDGRSWSRLANGGPPARDDAILAHDGNRGRTVLFGGRTQGGVL